MYNVFSCFQETCKTMLQGCVLVTGAQLRAKYSELENLTNEQKIAEYALIIIKKRSFSCSQSLNNVHLHAVNH